MTRLLSLFGSLLLFLTFGGCSDRTKPTKPSLVPESRDWLGAIEAVFRKPAELGRADGGQHIIIMLDSEQLNADGKGTRQWLIAQPDEKQSEPQIIHIPIGSAGALPILGSLRASFSRSESGDCDGQVLLDDNRLADAQFKCSPRPVLNLELHKNPGARWATIVVAFAGVAGGRAQDGECQLYSIDLVRRKAQLLGRSPNINVVATSPRGGRVMAFLHDGAHVYDLPSGADFAAKGTASSMECVGTTHSFANDEGTQVLIDTPSDRGATCPRDVRYNVTTDGLVIADR